jgi:hypothetical protein
MKRDHRIAVEAASADMSWKAIDRYSKDYIEMQTKDKVKFYKTPDSVLQAQLGLGQVPRRSRRKSAVQGNRTNRRRRFARRAVKWDHGHQRQPAHGLQPLLLRQEGCKPRAERGTQAHPPCTQSRCKEGLNVTAWQDTIRHARMVFFLAGDLVPGIATD